MSATLSEQVESLKQQTDLLRESVGKLVGQDLTNYNIGNIASAIEGVTPEPEEEEGYVRPSWYPNVEDILNNAPVIVKDGVKYTPCVGALCINNTLTFECSPTLTGADAYIFGDVVQNDIANANETTLEVGTTISHKWDEEFDIKNPDPLNNTYAVRWVIYYYINPLGTNHVHDSNNSLVEIIIKGLAISRSFMASGNDSKRYSFTELRFLKFSADCKYNSTMSTRFLYGNTRIEEVQIFCPISFAVSSYTTVNSDYFLGSSGVKKVTLGVISGTAYNFCNYASRLLYFYCAPESEITFTDGTFSSARQLRTMYLPNKIGALGSSFMANCYSLQSLIIPQLTTQTVLSSGFSSLTSLRSFIVPNGVTTIGNILADAAMLESLILPSSVTSLKGFILSASYKLREIHIPSSVTEMTTGSSSLFAYIPYVGLFNDFNISSINFAGQVPKTLQWLKDLCGWLKDRTGETANTMVLGTANLANANQIFLTFDADNKRNITWVDEGTEGAISITDFITNQLNWTLS